MDPIQTPTANRFRLALFALVGLTATALVGVAAIQKSTADEPPAQKPESSDDAKSNDAKPPAGSTEKSDEPKPAAEKKKGAAQSADNDPEPRREPSYSEILRELQREGRRDAKAVVRPGVTGITPRAIEQPVGNAIRPVENKLLPDGSRLVDRPGRLTREGEYFVFSFESRGQGAPERPVRLLPNRLLEDMEVYSEEGSRPVVFIVSGEVTEYRGVNYLLIQKLLVRPETGNLR